MNDKPNETFDPAAMLKEARNAGMDAWAKIMTQLVNTEGYAEATGSTLDAWLAASGPFRKAMESSMTHVLTNMNFPVRDDITRIAERLTNIEMRLDDLDARLSSRSPS